MIKKIFLTVLMSVCICLSATAANIGKIPYKSIQDGERISYSEEGVWDYATKKSDEYFTKKVSDGSGSFSEFYSPQGDFVFSTGCHYEFIYKGALIGYSNFDLKFYEFTIAQGIVNQRELSEAEVRELFNDFDIVKISEFSLSTNSIKLKKNQKHYKIILFNDTDRYFYYYGFTSNNAKFTTYQLKGFLDVTKKGMIQFSHFGDNTKQNPWFIIIIAG